MKRLAVLLIVALASCGRTQLPTTTLASSAPASYAHHRTFLYLGKKQKFKVPANVASIFVVAIGGEGGGSPIAHGGRVSAVLPVTPGEQLYVRVGGNGIFKAAGYNGGGMPGQNAYGRFNAYGGGGASDIRQGGDALGNRVLVAGGGGGQGGFDSFTRSTETYGVGGKGGNKTGGAGEVGYPHYSNSTCGANYAACGGGGGTQKAGGTGGIGGEGFFCYGNKGAAGTLGVGGTGAIDGTSSYGGCDGLGGGGGGGYYGGGGGGQGGGYGSYAGGGGGGGGGSSYVEPSAINVQMWRGWDKNEYGLIVFSW